MAKTCARMPGAPGVCAVGCESDSGGGRLSTLRRNFMTTRHDAQPPRSPGLPPARHIAADILEMCARHRPLDLESEGDPIPASCAAPRSRLTASWSRRCCGASARCATSPANFSIAGFPTRRRASRPRCCCGAVTDSFSWTCPTTRGGLSVRLGGRRTGAPRASRADQCRCCAHHAGRRRLLPSSTRRRSTRPNALSALESDLRRATARRIALAHSHEPPLDLR